MLMTNAIKELVLMKRHHNPVPTEYRTDREYLRWCNRERRYLEERYRLAVEGFNSCRKLGWKKGCEHYKDQYESMNELIFYLNQLRYELGASV